MSSIVILIIVPIVSFIIFFVIGWGMRSQVLPKCGSSADCYATCGKDKKCRPFPRGTVLKTSLEELGSYFDMKQSKFVQYDIDKNNEIHYDELNTFQKNRNFGETKNVSNIFDTFDKNKDNQITFDEIYLGLHQNKATFEDQKNKYYNKMDYDANEIITQPEYLKHNTDNMWKQLEDYDIDKNKSLNWSEWYSAKPSPYV